MRQCSIKGIVAQQLLVGPASDDSSALQNQNPIRSTHQRCAIDKAARFRIECDKACPIISSFRLSSAFRSFRPPRQRNSASPRPTDSRTPAGELRTSTDQNAPVFDKRHCCATTPRWSRVRRFFRAPEPKSDPLDAPTMALSTRWRDSASNATRLVLSFPRSGCSARSAHSALRGNGIPRAHVRPIRGRLQANSGLRPTRMRQCSIKGIVAQQLLVGSASDDSSAHSRTKIRSARRTNDALSTRRCDSASNATRLVLSFPRSGCPARSAHSVLRGNGTPQAHVRPIRGRLRVNLGLRPTRMRQCSIKGIVAQQLLVGPASDDSSALQNQNPIRSTHQRCAIDKTVRFRIECDKACPIISSFRLSSAFRSFRPPRQRNSASPRPTDSRTPAGELRTSTDQNAPVFDKRHCCATTPRWSRVRRFFRTPEPKSDPLDAPTMRYRQDGAIPHRMRQGLSYHFLVPAVQRVPLIPSSAATELRKPTSDRFEDACGRTSDFDRPECASVR